MVRNLLYIIFVHLVALHNTKPHLSKLEDCGRWMIFVGYERGTKAYKVYDPVTRRVHITHDVVFDEEDQWDWSKSTDEEATGEGDFSVECMVFSTRRALEEHADADAVEWELQSPAAGEASPQILPDGAGVDQEHVMPESSILSDQLIADHDDAPLRWRSVDNIVGQAPVPGHAVRNMFQGGGAHCQC
jgi:hypothetical protein